jgi:hypothetical protein
MEEVNLRYTVSTNVNVTVYPLYNDNILINKNKLQLCVCVCVCVCVSLHDCTLSF